MHALLSVYNSIVFFVVILLICFFIRVYVFHNLQKKKTRTSNHFVLILRNCLCLIVKFFSFSFMFIVHYFVNCSCSRSCPSIKNVLHSDALFLCVKFCDKLCFILYEQAVSFSSLLFQPWPWWWWWSRRALIKDYQYEPKVSWKEIGMD